MICYRSILVPMDFSHGALGALRYAVALRCGEDAIARDATIHALHVSQGAERELQRTGATLARFVRDGAGPGTRAVDSLAVPGDPRIELPKLAARHDLVVIGARNSTHDRDLAPGGVAEAVVRGSPTPVITVKWLAGSRDLGDRPPVREIVIATDLTEFSCASIRAAMSFGFRYGARVTVLYVGEALGGPGGAAFSIGDWVDRFYERDVGWHRDELGRFVHDRLGASRPVDLREVVRHGDAADEIVRECYERGADLLVVATHGRSGFKRLLLGSCAERVLRLAPCPVLTTRPDLEALRAAAPRADTAQAS
jgi:nucleotide-binding universal stress UspA family protein